MKIAIIASNQNLFSHKRLIDAARMGGHDVKTLIASKTRVEIGVDGHESGCDLAPSGHFDAAILRHGSSRTNFGFPILRQLELRGTWPLNDCPSIARSRNKLHCLQILARHGIAVPRTVYAETLDQADELLEAIKGPPVIVKVLDGAQGIGVELCQTIDRARAAMDALFQSDGHVMVQEFIKEADGADIRCVVLGGTVVAAMERRSAPGEFRSNLHQGGSAHEVEISQDEKRIAECAAAYLGLNFGAVDLLRSNRGPLVLEVNSSPGLQGIEAITGLDLAGLVIDFIAQNARSGC